MKTKRRNFGDWGEEQACEFLKRNGFDIIDRNIHATVGEIDIVAIKDGDNYFIEVKTRHAGDLANDLSITKAKKQKMEKMMKWYCLKKDITSGSQILAGLLVVADKKQNKVWLRMAVFY
jgi:putative endonuclease